MNVGKVTWPWLCLWLPGISFKNAFSSRALLLWVSLGSLWACELRVGQTGKAQYIWGTIQYKFGVGSYFERKMADNGSHVPASGSNNVGDIVGPAVTFTIFFFILGCLFRNKSDRLSPGISGDTLAQLALFMLTAMSFGILFAVAANPNRSKSTTTTMVTTAITTAASSASTTTTATASHITKPDHTFPDLPPTFNQTKELVMEYNISSWNLPQSFSDCVQMAIRNESYPTFIAAEYRCPKDSCSDSGNVLECWSFLLSPIDYLGKYFDKTPFRPKSKAECNSRDLVRRMDFSNESWFHDIPKENRGHKMHQCKEHFSRIMEDNTASLGDILSYPPVSFAIFIAGLFFLCIFWVKFCKKLSSSSARGSSGVAGNTQQSNNGTVPAPDSTLASTGCETTPELVFPPSYYQATLPSYSEANEMKMTDMINEWIKIWNQSNHLASTLYFRVVHQVVYITFC